jgi:hypothetical protein
VVAAAVFVASFAFHGEDDAFIGDEPSYLLYATSLGHGWGVDLRRAYEPENREWISPGVIESHAQVWRPGGPTASWHGIGLPIVLSPAAGRVPHWGIRAVMIFFTALLAYHLLALVRTVTGAPALVAAFAVLAIMASPPVIFHASLVYPEVLAGLLVVLALRSLASQRPIRLRLLGASVAAALLPWLNMRYATLTAALAVVTVGHAYLGATQPRLLQRLATTLAVASWPAIAGLVILGGLAAFNLQLYGGILPGSLPDARYYNMRNLYVYGVGGLVGFPLGILPFAPVLMVALVAVPGAAARIGVRTTTASAGVAFAYWAFNGYFGSAGLTLPGRYFVTIVPLLAVPLTVVMLHGRWAGRLAVAVSILLTAWSTATSARHLPHLYGADRRHIRPFGLTQPLWPMTVDETLVGPTELSGEAGTFGSQVGTLEQLHGSTVMVAREGREPAGFVSFGPFADLPRGRYEATFELVMEADRPVPPARIEIEERFGDILATAAVPFPLSGIRSTTETVQFDRREFLDVGPRVAYPGQGTLGVRRMSVRLIRGWPRATAESEAWKAVLWIAALAAVSIVWRRRALGSRGSP